MLACFTFVSLRQPKAVHTYYVVYVLLTVDVQNVSQCLTVLVTMCHVMPLFEQ